MSAELKNLIREAVREELAAGKATPDAKETPDAAETQKSEGTLAPLLAMLGMGGTQKAEEAARTEPPVSASSTNPAPGNLSIADVVALMQLAKGESKADAKPEASSPSAGAGANLPPTAAGMAQLDHSAVAAMSPDQINELWDESIAPQVVHSTGVNG